MAKTFEQIAEFLSIIVKSVTESYVFRLFSAMASQKTTQELSEESNIATLVLGWTGFGNGFTDCCNLGGSRNNLMKQRILYLFYQRTMSLNLLWWMRQTSSEKLMSKWFQLSPQIRPDHKRLTTLALQHLSKNLQEFLCHPPVSWPITIQSLLFLLQLQVYRQGLLCTCTQCLNKCKTFTFTDNLNFYIYN